MVADCSISDRSLSRRRVLGLTSAAAAFPVLLRLPCCPWVWRDPEPSARGPFLVRAGEFELEFSAGLKINGARVHLSDREFRIIELLARHRGEIFSKLRLFGYLHPGVSEYGIKITDVYICHARKIIQSTAKGHSFIETVWGKGYRFGEPNHWEGCPTSA